MEPRAVASLEYKVKMEDAQERGRSGITPWMAYPTNKRTRQTLHIPLLQTPGQPPHLHRYGPDGTDNTYTTTSQASACTQTLVTTTGHTLHPEPTTYAEALTTSSTRTPQTTTTTTHLEQNTTPNGTATCSKCYGLVRKEKLHEHIHIHE
ncbi:uncharacterized protein LOC124411483 [Diprion similis]|uniref:uncharacterized protein LOC124411483 n=1 Tax=Diprion similis TaxID=362088 RepID=UPI001EF84650|nr:uncharacterized protein LOC124411483 [Diprion similis]